MQMSYWRFAAMIATSTLVMFGLMYIHTYIWEHVYFSETRAWMALLMGAMMAIVMLGFMLNMYKSRAVNAAIFIGSAAAFAVSAWAIRSQATVSGLDYMEAMVPHHSIAILTSERAGIEDPRVRKLADEIIEAQRKEISEMVYLIRALERDGPQPTQQRHTAADVVPAAEAVRRADVAKTDLEPMTAEEVQRVLGTSAVCRFAFAPDGAPVAAATATGRGSSRGVIKLHGHLVSMEVQDQTPVADGFRLSSDMVSVIAASSSPTENASSQEAEAHLQIGDSLSVGYAGFYSCSDDR